MQFTEGAAVQAEGWATWLAKYVSLLLYCMGQYTSAQAAGDTAPVQHLPCIRLLVDPHFMSKLLQVLIACCCLSCVIVRPCRGVD